MKFKQEITGSNYDCAALTRFQEYNKHLGKLCVHILLRFYYDIQNILLGNRQCKPWPSG